LHPANALAVAVQRLTILQDRRDNASSRRLARARGLVSNGTPVELSRSGERAFNFYAPLSTAGTSIRLRANVGDVDHDLFVRSENILHIAPMDDAANAYLEARSIESDDPRMMGY
jgi:hypothetical protein